MNIFGTTGAERRAWLDRQGQNVLDAIQYYAGPGIPVNAFATIADAFNPVADIQRAGTAARGAVQPGLTASERAGYVGSALTDMASVLAPVAGAAYADDAARGLTEGLANWSMPADDAMTRFVVDDSGAFAGIRAKTADLDALSRAQAMTEAGASRDDVWRETGWFEGVDGKWRFEIDDYASTFRGTGTPSEIARARGDTVGDAFYHWNAFKAYPDLRDVRFKGGEPGTLKGAYMPSFDIMVPDAIMVSDGVPDARSTMLHELQHAIQGREGFAVGANPGEYASGAMFHRRARKLQEALSRELTGGLSFTPKEIEQNLRYGVPERLQEIADMHGFPSIDEAIEFLRREDEMRTPFSQYQRTAGEVEARNVQARQNFTADQRRAVPPWLTQDVPDDQQIIRGISNGPMASIGSPAEAQAQEVLDLLTSGRASEVTDEMLAAADPQYLYRNYDLPMDEASRMARAREMGLTDDQYHVTTADIDAFRPSDTGLAGRGVYTGDYPEDIESYATARMDGSDRTGLTMMPLRAPAYDTYAPNIAYTRAADSDPEWPYDASMEENIAGMRRVADRLSAEGYSGVKSQPGERVTFSPASLRSRFARFDPRLAHLRNLSAGVGGLGIVGSQSEEERSEEINAILAKYGV